MRNDFIRQLATLQGGRANLRDFELWLVGHLQQIADGDDEELKEGADKLDALLIQYGEGVIAAAELDETIENILRNLSTVAVPAYPSSPAQRNELSSSSVDVEIEFREMGAVQNLRFPVLQVA